MPETTRKLAEAIFAMSKQSWRQAAKGTSGLTESEFLALEFLNAHGTASIGEITAAIFVLPAQMSRIIHQLEDQGFITRRINDRDKRKMDVTMTAQGRKVHARYRQAKLAPIKTALERLTPQEREAFMGLVSKMGQRTADDTG